MAFHSDLRARRKTQYIKLQTAAPSCKHPVDGTDSDSASGLGISVGKFVQKSAKPKMSLCRKGRWITVICLIGEVPSEMGSVQHIPVSTARRGSSDGNLVLVFGILPQCCLTTSTSVGFLGPLSPSRLSDPSIRGVFVS